MTDTDRAYAIVEKMREAIMNRYGPTIHNEFVAFMTPGRVARIFMRMNNLRANDIPKFLESSKDEPIIRKPQKCIKGQISLFEE